MTLTLNLKNPYYCDGCQFLKKLDTFGGHHRCEKYFKVMLPNTDTFMTERGVGVILRLVKCLDEYKVKKPV